MNCVRPPLLKKPARGFGWSCGPCSRRQERRLEARNTTNGDKTVEGEEEEVIEEEEEDRGMATDDVDLQNHDDLKNATPHPPTAEQLAQSRLWPYRYLGIHCRMKMLWTTMIEYTLERVLDLDRSIKRTCSRGLAILLRW